MAFLIPDNTSNLNGVVVKEYLLTKHNPNNIAMPNYTLPAKPLGITIHNTDWITTAQGTNPSEQYSRATVNGNMNDVRVHYYVDNICAWQNLPLNLSGWHAADGNGDGNRKTIAIECIMSGAYNATDKKSEDNCARLAAYLLHKYGLTINNLYTHTHWLNVRDGVTGNVDYLNTRKHPYKWCPLYILPHWNDFKTKVSEYLKMLNATTQPVNSSTTAFKVGDLVSIKANAKYYTGEAIPAWVAAEKWYISSISGNRAVLGQNESKSRNIQSPVSTSSLVLVKSVTPVQSTGLYTKTLTAGTPIYTEIGKNADNAIATTTKYTIVEEKVVDYVKYGKLKSGIGWVVIEYLKRKFDIKNTNDVKELQMTLTNKGFNCGAADGIVGDNTINAMFQALCEQWLQIKK